MFQRHEVPKYIVDGFPLDPAQPQPSLLCVRATLGLTRYRYAPSLSKGQETQSGLLSMKRFWVFVYSSISASGFRTGYAMGQDERSENLPSLAGIQR